MTSLLRVSSTDKLVKWTDIPTMLAAVGAGGRTDGLMTDDEMPQYFELSYVGGLPSFFVVITTAIGYNCIFYFLYFHYLSTLMYGE